MGNDLLIATLAIEADKEPGWEAAFAKVEAMTKADIELLSEEIENWLGDMPGDEDGEIDVEECRERLKDLVSDVQAACSSEHRHLYASEYVVPGWIVYITGGDSWGDSPSEEFDSFNAFLQLGLAEIAGFASRFVQPIKEGV